MTVQRPDIDRSACLATGAVNIEPRGAGQDSAANRRRPQRSTAARKCAVPSIDDSDGVIMGGLFSRVSAHVEGEAIGARGVVFRHGAKYPPPAGSVPPIRPCVTWSPPRGAAKGNE